MKFEEYQKLYAEALKLDDEFETVQLPVELKEGETPQEGFLRFLIEQDLIESQGDYWRIKDREKINDFNPNLLKILDAMVMASVHAEMDTLMELGYVYMTVDEEGNILYELTEAGEEFVRDDEN